MFEHVLYGHTKNFPTDQMKQAHYERSIKYDLIEEEHVHEQ